MFPNKPGTVPPGLTLLGVGRSTSGHPWGIPAVILSGQLTTILTCCPPQTAHGSLSRTPGRRAAWPGHCNSSLLHAGLACSHCTSRQTASVDNHVISGGRGHVRHEVEVDRQTASSENGRPRASVSHPLHPAGVVRVWAPGVFREGPLSLCSWMPKLLPGEWG